MITAVEAKKNVTIYKVQLTQKVELQINNILNAISPDIEFRSQNGCTTLTFAPYDKSRFPNIQTLEIAQQLFTHILKSNGYNILENDYNTNILKIQW